MSTDADQTTTPDEPTEAPEIEQETDASNPPEPVAELASPEVSEAPGDAVASEPAGDAVADDKGESAEPVAETGDAATVAPEVVETVDGTQSTDGEIEAEAEAEGEAEAEPEAEGEADAEEPSGPVEAAPTSASAIESASSPKKKDAKPGLATPAAIAPKLTPEQESELARFNAYQEAAEAVDARDRAVKKAEAVKTAAAAQVKALEAGGNATAEEKTEAEQAYRDSVAALDSAKKGEAPVAPADTSADAPPDDAQDDGASAGDGASADSPDEPVSNADAEAAAYGEPSEPVEVAEPVEAAAAVTEPVETDGEPASPEPVEA